MNLPRISCWNVNDWGLAYQAQLADEGHAVEWTIGCPLIVQGANKGRWEAFIAANEQYLPRVDAAGEVTLRWHNWLAEWTELKPELRGEFESSPLIWRRREDGSLDSTPAVDPFGPIEAWVALGESLAKCEFVVELAKRLPNLRSVALEENNEPNKLEDGSFVVPLPREPNKPVPKDKWGNRLVEWRPNLEGISLRTADYAKLNPDPNKLAVALDRAYRERYEAFTASLLANLPAVWKGKAYTVGYADLPIDSLDFDWRNPANDWQYSPGTATLYFHGEKSDRIYADKSGSPNSDHRRLRCPMTVAMNAEPFNEIIRAIRPQQHNEVSVWLSPQYGRQVGREMGHYITPSEAFGFYRGVVWAARADVYRYFASSQEGLDSEFYDGANDPPEVKRWTDRDFFNSLVKSVAEIRTDKRLAKFFREGKDIYTDEPSFYGWNLPSGPLMNRLLVTDADKPRYETVKGKQVDRWAKAGGEIEHNVFALAWRIGESYLIYAYAPRETRPSVIVDLPGSGKVEILNVGPEGVFKFAGKPLRERSHIELVLIATLAELVMAGDSESLNSAFNLVNDALSLVTAWEDAK